MAAGKFTFPDCVGSAIELPSSLQLWSFGTAVFRVLIAP